MKRTLFIAYLAGIILTLLGSGCRRSGDPLPLALDTIRSGGDTNGVKPPDTTHSKVDSVKSDLPPMAKAIEPAMLAVFLPKMQGWSVSGEMEHEIQVRDNFNRSRVAQTYIMGQKKVKIDINDLAFVPYLYDPWQKFKGNYLDDDNTARTETTTIGNYRAVQTMEKHDPRGSVTVFPGKRYVVTIVMDGAESINDVRRIAESLDLRGLENLQ